MKDNTHNEYAKRIIKVLNFIQKHLDERFELEQLAGIAHFSPFHFHRIFRAFTGESIAKYIRRLKLERAAGSLKYSDKLISLISLEAGYENTESFSRVFKSQFNKTPQEFRKMSKNELEKSLNPSLNMEKNNIFDVKIIENVPKKTLICMRHTGRYFDVGSTWNKLIEWVNNNNFNIKSTLGISYDNPKITEEEKIRYDACVELDKSIIPGEGMHKIQIKGGRYAVATIRGSYDNLNAAYDYFYVKLLSENSLKLRNQNCFEVYKRMSPDYSPDDYITEIFFPIK